MTREEKEIQFKALLLVPGNLQKLLLAKINENVPVITDEKLDLLLILLAPQE